MSTTSERRPGLVPARRTAILAVLLACAPAAGLPAQEATPAPEPARARKTFFTANDALLAGAFAAGTVALLPLDRELARNFRKPANQADPTLRDAASFFNFMGQPAPVIIGPSLYLAGRLTHRRQLAALGLHSTEAILLGGSITSILKVATGRARPYVSGDSTPDSYAFLRGFKGNQYQSFPSGHTTAAFSLAAAMTAETSHWIDEVDAWPGWKVVIGSTLYGGAALVGLARMYDDRHWASDVMAGAAIGTFSGIKVVRYAYRHPDNRVDRWLLSARVFPSPDGRTVLAWALPAPF